MKTKLLSILLLVLGINNINAQCTDYVTIPDAIFKAYLVGNTSINTDGDSEISCDEATAFTDTIDVGEMSITDLTGIEAFVNITRLDCDNNDLTSLDVSANTALKDLYCYSNALTSLDVSANVALETLNCRGNSLTILDVSASTALETLYCNENSLTSLDVSANTALERLYCSRNDLTSLDVSAKTALTTLYCSDNELTSLNVSANTALKTLYCDNNELTSLDVSASTGLTKLYCYSNSITSLDVSASTALKKLYCYSNSLTSLDVSANTALENLQCGSNPLTSLNIANGNNSNMGPSSFHANSNLSCIQVDDKDYADTNWVDYKADTALYSEDCITTCYVVIPDANFKSALVSNTAINTDEDSEISCDEATDFTGTIDVGAMSIADLTGIEAFVNITRLDCDNNDLTSLDVSANIALTELKCQLNNLTSLDLSNNTALTIFHCNTNDLTELNVANGNNSNITSFNLLGNDDLTCMQIDAGFDPDAAGWIKSSYTNYSEDCSLLPPTTYVPDDNFEQYLIERGWDDTLDDYVLTANINVVDNMNVTNKGINNLTGIEDFTDLQILTCQNNNLTTLDLSNNTALRILRAKYNNINTIDVSNNTALEELELTSNALTAIDVSNNTALEELELIGNALTAIDVSNNTALTSISLSSNEITSLNIDNNIALTSISLAANEITSLDVSNNTALESIYCHSNSLTNLDLSNNSVLKTISCYNNALSNLNVANGNNSNITLFDATNNTNLYCIQIDDSFTPPVNWDVDNAASYGTDCSAITIIPDSNFEQALIDLGYDTGTPNGFVLTEEINTVTSLIVSVKNISDLTGIEDFTALEILRCDNNDLTTLNLSQNTALTHLQCFFNDLTSLDLSNNTALIDLKARYNELTTLDVTNNIALTYIGLNNNELTSLDLSSNTALTSLVAPNNLLTTLNVANGNNSNFTSLNITGNSNLSCVQVDDKDYADSNWSSEKDAIASYNEDCEATLSSNSIDSNIIEVYPNPVIDILEIKSEESIFNVEIYSLAGKLLLNSTEKKVNVFNLKYGVYILKIKTEGGQEIIRKIIKK